MKDNLYAARQNEGDQINGTSSLTFFILSSTNEPHAREREKQPSFFSVVFSIIAVSEALRKQTGAANREIGGERTVSFSPAEKPSTTSQCRHNEDAAHWRSSLTKAAAVRRPSVHVSTPGRDGGGANDAARAVSAQVEEKKKSSPPDEERKRNSFLVQAARHNLLAPKPEQKLNASGPLAAASHRYSL